MRASIGVKVEGIEKLEAASGRFEALFSQAAIEARVILLAREAGQLLQIAAVRACIEAVYDNPSFPSLWTRTPSHPPGTYYRNNQDNVSIGSDGNEATRTNALLDSHVHIDLGLTQISQIDPEAEAEPGPHSGRETVLDYAIPVHEGYTQWVFGHDTGTFHPGRFWFDVAATEAGPVIASFLEIAFGDAIDQALGEAFG